MPELQNRLPKASSGARSDHDSDNATVAAVVQEGNCMFVGF